MIGSLAILLWSLLALLTAWAGGIPPFQLVAMTFAVAYLVGGTIVALRGRAALVRLRQPPAAWLLGVGGALVAARDLLRPPGARPAPSLDKLEML